MPELLDEERLTEDELLRLREEEEALRAAVAAQVALVPQSVPAEIPPPAIAFDEFGASMPPAPGGSFLPTAGIRPTDEQNAFIIARNQRERDLEQGVDPIASQKQQLLLANQARRFAGVQKYQQLINDGATREEALALAGVDMFANDPKAYAAEVVRPSKSPLRPEVTSVDGVKMYRTGPNSFAQARPEVPDRPPPEAVAGQKILAGQITDARKDLDRAEARVAERISPNVSEVNAALRAREKLRGLEQKYQVGSTNWMGTAQTPKDLTVDVARDFLKASGGDKAKARKMATDAGYRL